MNKREKIAVEPINEDNKASISIKNNHVHINGWRFDLQGREGGLNANNEECALAVLDYITEKLRRIIKNKSLLRDEHEVVILTEPKLEYEAERMACLAINFAAGKQ